MKNESAIRAESQKQQSGAALVTTLVITLLLTTACIAMLSAAGYHSRNVTDVLSETKAFYAAESGIQATINVLRNDNTVTYSYAVANPKLSAKLPYNYPVGAPARVVIGQAANTYTPNTGVAYEVLITDPDNTQAYTTFTTSGTFLQSDGTTYANSRTFGTAPNTTTISFVNQSTTNAFFTSGSSNSTLGSFQIVKQGSGAQITNLRFKIDYMMSAPRTAGKGIRGTITQTAAGSTLDVAFDSYLYFLTGSNISLCQNVNCTLPNPLGSSFTMTLPAPTTSPVNTPLYVRLTPVEPYRLLLKSTGYGPNGAQKQLEAIIQRNFFNDLSSPGAVDMIGSSNGFRFEPGNSAGVTYSGDDASSGANIPSIAVTNQANLDTVITNAPKTPLNPPPAVLSSTEIPDWQQSPAALDALVAKFRRTAQNSLRYFNSGQSISNPGNYSTATGITFCDGDCTVSGDGGGILVVTGKLTSNGGFNFKGLIIVTGANGFQRNGNGGGSIIGNIVVAPYDPTNLAGGFLGPKYYVNGGGGSDVIYSSTNTNFDGQSAVSDFMQGVAEK